MTASTPAHTTAPSAEPNDLSPAPRETCPAVPRRRLQEQEADRRFEAGVRWFLAVSRAA